MPVLHNLLDDDKARIHSCTLRLLAEMGVRVESRSILERLADFGAQVDAASQIAKFPIPIMEDFLQKAERFDWTAARLNPTLDTNPGISSGKYLNPENSKHEDWTEKRIRDYVKLAKALPNVDRINMLTSPIPGTPHEIQPLVARFQNWQMGTTQFSFAVHNLELCPFIEEFHALHAEASGISVEESISAGVYLICPLKFPRTEAEQFLYFADRGYPCWIGRMMSSGGSGPVTLPGAVAIHLAENIFTNIMQHLYYGSKALDFGCSISPLDMKRGEFCYGRPEKALANHLFGQMAVHYGASYVPQTGSADAKTPGSEAASQKLLTALPALMCFSKANLRAGILSVDEVNSPIQMILDNEVAGSLHRMMQPMPVNEDTLAYDTILEAGHAGVFTDKMHTFEHFQEEVWDSRLWSSTLLDGWLDSGCKTAEALALEKWHEIMAGPEPEPSMSPEVEKKVRDIMDRALKHVRSGKGKQTVQH